MDKLNPEEISFYYDISNTISTYIVKRYLRVINAEGGPLVLTEDDVDYDILDPLVPIINACNIFAYDTFVEKHDFPQNMIDICNTYCDTRDKSEIGSFVLATYKEYEKIDPLREMCKDIHAFVPMILMDFIGCGLATEHLPYDPGDVASILLENMIDDINS